MTEAYKELEAVSGALAKKMDELSIYKNLFQYSSDAIVIINDKGFFIDVNDEFVRQIGFTKERLLSQPFFSFMHPEDVEGATRPTSGLYKAISTQAFRIATCAEMGSTAYSLGTRQQYLRSWFIYIVKQLLQNSKKKYQ